MISIDQLDSSIEYSDIVSVITDSRLYCYEGAAQILRMIDPRRVYSFLMNELNRRMMIVDNIYEHSVRDMQLLTYEYNDPLNLTVYVSRRACKGSTPKKFQLNLSNALPDIIFFIHQYRNLQNSRNFQTYCIDDEFKQEDAVFLYKNKIPMSFDRLTYKSLKSLHVLD